MGELNRHTTASEIHSTIEGAFAMLANAHHALGRMSACGSAPEFSKATADFLAVARDVSARITRLAEPIANADRVGTFTTWLAAQAAPITRNPLDTDRGKRALAIRASRVARGSNPPYSGELPATITIGKLGGWVLADSIASVQPDDFYFQHLEDRTAIDLCAEYLEQLAAVLASAKQEIKRLAL